MSFDKFEERRLVGYFEDKSAAGTCCAPSIRATRQTAYCLALAGKIYDKTISA